MHTLSYLSLVERLLSDKSLAQKQCTYIINMNENFLPLEWALINTITSGIHSKVKVKGNQKITCAQL